LVEVENEGVRYILSFNPEKENEDRQTRLHLVEKTKEKLQMIERNVTNGRWKRSKVIAKRLFSWVNKWGMERFFNYEYDDGKFTFELDEERLKTYEAIDGFYVITTDVVEGELSTSEVRDRYKSLSQVEQAFRALKTTDLFMRPIRHWNPERVKGHIFMCMLAYLIVWKARELFADFITHEQVSNDAKAVDDCHSLRVLWERLDRWVQIGKFQIGGKIIEQIKVLPAKARPILRAANALPTLKKLERLKLPLIHTVYCLLITKFQRSIIHSRDHFPIAL
jgi:transposase